MADTIRTLADLQTLLADNTAGDISPQDVRDFLVSVHGGGLTPNAQTVTTTDITGAVGQMYVCTIAGLTANRNLTLPSAAPGQRVGVYIADGDDTYSLILIGATSQTINGGSAATEWSRVFIKGECVVFLCVAANTWIVESDGRMPCSCKLWLSTSTNTSGQSALTYYLPTDFSGVWSIEGTDVGNVSTVATSKMTARRAGKYLCSIMHRPITGSVDQQTYTCRLTKNGTTTAVFVAQIVAPGTVNALPQGSSEIVLAAGDTLQFMFRNNEANYGSTGAATAAGAEGRFTFTEIL